MPAAPASIRAALLLTNRLVSLDVKPLTAREFWRLTERVDPGDLVDLDTSAIAELGGVDLTEAARFRGLLDATTALSFEEERLRDGGISLISALDERFPGVLRGRLGAACPPFLLVAGPSDFLDRSGLGVVGSRDASDEALAVARAAAQLAVRHDWPVVNGLARGVDQAAIDGAVEAGGVAIGVPAEGVLRASQSAAVRRRVHSGDLCLASPYAPNARFSNGSAMGRNKIVYALSRMTFVVTAENGSGGTWGGAKEALDNRYAPVAAWAGGGASGGNPKLIERGATPISKLEHLATIDTKMAPDPTQDSLF